MSAVNAIAEQTAVPAYVRFRRVAVEDKAKSLQEGRFVGIDVDYALITPPYSKDCVEMKVSQWKLNLKLDVDNGRIPDEWHQRYLKMYEAWRNGQELPVDGTPVRGWGVISPAQQESLIRLNILTVEDLSKANDEGLRRIGMGAIELKNKARNWLSQLTDKGPLTQKVTALETENEGLRLELETLKKQIGELMSDMRQRPEDPTTASNIPASIPLEDILPESPTISIKRR